MAHQVTDVIGPKRLDPAVNACIPFALKLAWTAFVLLWAPLYWRQYGPQNFLFYCDVGNLLILVGLWLESSLVISWQAVGLVVFQTLYAFDLIGAFISGHHAFGGTEYMFDSNIPILVRALGLYHFVVPVLLVWTVRRLGYDPRAWKSQTVLMAVLVPTNFFWHPANNVNFARGIGHEQHVVPPWLYLIAYLTFVPLVVYWPTHVALRRWASPSAAACSESQLG